jgi:hypothetical protein
MPNWRSGSMARGQPRVPNARKEKPRWAGALGVARDQAVGRNGRAQFQPLKTGASSTLNSHSRPFALYVLTRSRTESTESGREVAGARGKRGRRRRRWSGRADAASPRLPVMRHGSLGVSGGGRSPQHSRSGILSTGAISSGCGRDSAKSNSLWPSALPGAHGLWHAGLQQRREVPRRADHIPGSDWHPVYEVGW